MPQADPIDPQPPRSPWEAFQREVMADEALQAELSRPQIPDEFVALALARADDRGIALRREDLMDRLRPGASGLPGRSAGDEMADGWPPRGWLPRLVGADPQPHVEWVHLAGEPLTQPFYEETLNAARARPFNRVFRPRTGLAALAAGAPADARRPDGLIFHLSRCGSTLAAQMLAAVPEFTVVSEAAPIDAAVRLESAAADAHAGLLAAMVAAVGRRRFAHERRLLVKLDSWHILSGPLLRRAFEGTPWVFIYRDPLEVLVSHMRRRGSQTVRGAPPAPLFAIDAEVPDDEYCAIVLRRLCEAALAHFAGGGGRLVNYSDLPDAVETQILPHFGVALGDAERTLMARAAARDAKAPWQAFTPDAAAKREEASPRLKELVQRHLAEPYRALEALRLTTPGSQGTV